MGACIQYLPPEVLLRIFSIGCDDKSEIPPRKCIPRKRKPFAHLARQICFQWRAIVDHPVCLADPHFWVAYLFLWLSDKDAEPFGRQSYTHSPFVKRLINFRYCLTTSKGCNLMISISLPISDVWICSIEEYSPDAVLALRLLLHGMRLILPYQNQVTSIEMEGHVPLAWGQFVSLIMTEFRTAHILEEIHLRQGDYIHDMPQSIPGMLNLFEATDLGQLHPNSINRTRLPLSTKHLPRLNTLNLPDASWLNVRELKLNSPISCLHISKCPTPVLLIKLLRSQFDLLGNLTTLKVGSLGCDPILHDGPENIAFHLPRPITFRKLTSISLASAYTNWVNFFFKCARMPRLECVRIDCSEMMNSHFAFSATEEKSVKTVGAAKKKVVNILALPKSLITLDIFIGTSWSSLKLLRTLATSSIETLRIRIHMLQDLEPPKADLLLKMAEVLSHFEPRSLHVEGTLDDITQFILCYINPHRLRSLEIGGHNMDGWSADSHFSVDRFLLRQKLPIVLPSLTEVKLKGKMKSFRHFLMSISANMLRRVSLLTDDHARFYNSAKSISFAQLLSVEAIEITTRDPDLSDIWKIIPNVRTLNISIDVNAFTLDQGNFIFTYLVERIDSIIGTPRRKDGMIPLLLRLQSFSLTYAIKCSQAHLNELSQSISHGKLHGSIKKVLVTREKFGAIPLDLKPILLEIRPVNRNPFHVQGPDRDILIKIIARAQDVTSLLVLKTRMTSLHASCEEGPVMDGSSLKFSQYWIRIER